MTFRLNINLIFIIILIIASFFIKIDVQARVSFKTCVERASIDNTYYPMRIDKITTITGVGCRQDGDKVIYVYENVLDLPKSKIPKTFINETMSAIRTQICTTPSIRELLALVDMEYTYYDSSNIYLGTINNRIENCNN